MSKELKKFQDRYKKIAPKLKACTKKTAEGYKKEIYQAFSDARFHGEAIITEALADARDNGITGNKFSDFAKDSGFKDALKLYDKTCAAIEKPQKNLEAFSAEASAVADELARLHIDIEKDLKKRRDKSDSKSDIEELRDQVAKDWKEVSAASKVIESVPKPQLEYVGNFQKTVEKLVKQAPAEAEKKRDDVMLPQMLVDRNRAKAKSGAAKALKDINALCEEAMKKAESSLKDAQPALKKAAEILKVLKKTRDQYDKALEHSAKSTVFKNSKDKPKIEADVAAIGAAYDKAERQVRGIATTIKKAG